jgi:hypothetical protein
MMPIRILAALVACMSFCAQAAERALALSIARGAVPAESRTLRVEKGDRVRIAVKSDAPGELHLHGYGLEVSVTPGGAAELALDARATGRFPLEWHPAGQARAPRGHHTPPLAWLEVRPK